MMTEMCENGHHGNAVRRWLPNSDMWTGHCAGTVHPLLGQVSYPGLQYPCDCSCHMDTFYAGQDAVEEVCPA